MKHFVFTSDFRKVLIEVFPSSNQAERVNKSKWENKEAVKCYLCERVIIVHNNNKFDQVMCEDCSFTEYMNSLHVFK